MAGTLIKNTLKSPNEADDGTNPCPSTLSLKGTNTTWPFRRKQGGNAVGPGLHAGGPHPGLLSFHSAQAPRAVFALPRTVPGARPEPPQAARHGWGLPSTTGRSVTVEVWRRPSRGPGRAGTVGTAPPGRGGQGPAAAGLRDNEPLAAAAPRGSALLSPVPPGGEADPDAAVCPPRPAAHRGDGAGPVQPTW